ncbi:MAG: aldehyde-activating protein [Ponticaulis sp.]|nr:aldehyde-activating protein [Ponticaulis sp.]
MGAISGQCLCGEVSFELTTEISHLDACHCRMCQRWTGSAFIGVDVHSANAISFNSDASLKWFKSSDWAERGFCSTCGSSLFYRLLERDDFVAVNSGSLDLPAGMSLTKEIFIDEKPDYYSLEGQRPCLTGAEFMASLQASSEDV